MQAGRLSTSILCLRLMSSVVSFSQPALAQGKKPALRSQIEVFACMYEVACCVIFRSTTNCYRSCPPQFALHFSSCSHTPSRTTIFSTPCQCTNSSTSAGRLFWRACCRRSHARNALRVRRQKNQAILRHDRQVLRPRRKDRRRDSWHRVGCAQLPRRQWPRRAQDGRWLL